MSLVPLRRNQTNRLTSFLMRINSDAVPGKQLAKCAYGNKNGTVRPESVYFGTLHILSTMLLSRIHRHRDSSRQKSPPSSPFFCDFPAKFSIIRESLLLRLFVTFAVFRFVCTEDKLQYRSFSILPNEQLK